MSSKKILAKNTFWLGLNEMVSKGIMFLVTISLVRYLGPLGFGSYNFAVSLVAILTIFSDFGVITILTREVAKNKAKAEEYLGNALSLRVFTSLLIMVLMLVVSPFLGENRNNLLLITLVLLFNLGQQFHGLLVSILMAFEKMELVFVSKLAYYLGLMVAAGITIKFNLGIDWLMVGYFLVTIICLIVTVLLINKLKVRTKLHFDKKFIKEMLKEAAPLFGFIACSQIYMNLDTILIARYFGNESVGIYQSAYKILFAFQSINVINSVTFPRFAVLISENKTETLNKLIRIVVGVSLIGLIPLSLIISVNSQFVIKLIYGAGFLAAAPILINFIWAGVANYFRILVTNLLVAKGKQHWVFYSVLVGLILNGILNWWVMPKMGFEFASMSMLISEIAILIIAGVGLKMGRK